MENKDTFTEVVHIPLDNIEFDDVKIRPAQLEAKEWKRFELSIGLEGVQIPIHVRPKKDENGIVKGRYIGIDGQQRHRASINQNKGTIPALIRDWDDAACMRLQGILNHNRIPQKNSQYREHIKAYMIMYVDRSRAEIAKDFNMFESELSTIIGLKRLTDEATKLLDEEKIPMTSAVALSRVPTQLQNKLLPEAIGMSVDEFINHVKRETQAAQGVATHEIHPILRKKEEFLAEIERLNNLAETHKGTEKYAYAVDRLKWGLKIDPQTLEDEEKKRKDKADGKDKTSMEKQVKDHEKKIAELHAKLALKEEQEVKEEVGV